MLSEILEKRRSLLKALQTKRKTLVKIINMKMRRPEFLRHLWWKFDKFQNKLKWKRPRGKDNPMRLCLKGYPPLARIGYRTPNEFRNIHPSGLKMAVVSSARDLEKLDPANYIIYISSTVGLKKRQELISVAKSKGFKIANE
uniref:Large ribosomal subunit protein eL32 n=1 Tax=Ignisphaera aggregans TaxID=334771 RepID=A0A7C2Z920_9CREN